MDRLSLAAEALALLFRRRRRLAGRGAFGLEGLLVRSLRLADAGCVEAILTTGIPIAAAKSQLTRSERHSRPPPLVPKKNITKKEKQHAKAKGTWEEMFPAPKTKKNCVLWMLFGTRRLWSPKTCVFFFQLRCGVLPVLPCLPCFPLPCLLVAHRLLGAEGVLAGAAGGARVVLGEVVEVGCCR